MTIPLIKATAMVFVELIGYDVHPGTGKMTPTTWGKIHYSKDGVHIVPYRRR